MYDTFKKEELLQAHYLVSKWGKSLEIMNELGQDHPDLAEKSAPGLRAIDEAHALIKQIMMRIHSDNTEAVSTILDDPTYSVVGGFMTGFIHEPAGNRMGYNYEEAKGYIVLEHLYNDFYNLAAELDV